MNPVLSLVPAPNRWAERVNSPSNDLIDYENGGPVLNNSESSSNDFEWRCYYEDGVVLIDREGVEPFAFFSAPDITLVSLAFDQAMQPHVAYVEAGVAKFRYWDTLAGAYATLTLSDARDPRCCSDEKHIELSTNRDLILTYLRSSTLYVRLQRDRYSVEYAKVANEDHEPITTSTRLLQFGRNTGSRLQWHFVP